VAIGTGDLEDARASGYPAESNRTRFAISRTFFFRKLLRQHIHARQKTNRFLEGGKVRFSSHFCTHCIEKAEDSLILDKWLLQMTVSP
jgi:hypothetical protein